MRNLTRFLYGGLALAIAGGITAGCINPNRGSNPPTKEPTSITLETPTPTSTYIPDTPTSGVTPIANTPIFTPTATATTTVTAKPTDTPETTVDWRTEPPIKVSCGTCFAGNPPPDTAEKDYVYYAGYYENIAREAYIKVADAFGMVPTNPDGSLIEFNIAIDNQRIRFGVNNGPNSYSYPIGGFRADSTLTHEMVHRFLIYLTGVSPKGDPYHEGLAYFVQGGENLIHESASRVYDNVLLENHVWKRESNFIPHDVGFIIYEGLIREAGKKGIDFNLINRKVVNRIIENDLYNLGDKERMYKTLDFYAQEMGLESNKFYGIMSALQPAFDLINEKYGTIF